MRTSALVDFYTPRPEELEAYDKAYARLDAISGVIGVSPSRPIPGEMPSQYRKRLLKSVLPHSPKFRHMDIIGLGGHTLDFAEDLIYQDAIKSANDPLSVRAGQTRTVQYRDEVGRLITKTIGQSPDWMNYFISDGVTVNIKRPK